MTLLLALHRLNNFGTCLGRVLRFLPFFALLILTHVSAETTEKLGAVLMLYFQQIT